MYKLWGKSAEIQTGGAGAFYFPIELTNVCLITLTAPQGFSTNTNGGNIVSGNTSTIAAELFNWGPITAMCKIIVIGI